jgi:hypothetical protein
MIWEDELAPSCTTFYNVVLQILIAAHSELFRIYDLITSKLSEEMGTHR